MISHEIGFGSFFRFPGGGAPGGGEGENVNVPIIVNCNHPDWKAVLKTTLQGGLEAELTNFDYTVDGALCETLALAHKMEFKLNAKASMGIFRKSN